jgi:hypothetical protein
MPLSDIYTFRSGSVALAAAAQAPVLSVVAGTTVRLWGLAIRVEVGTTLAAAGNNLQFVLARPGNTPTGTTTTTGNPHDFSAPACIGTGYTAWSTAPTQGAVLAEWQVPQASGSEWVEYPIPEATWQIPAIANAAANGGLHIFCTPSVATSTPVFVNFVISQ